MAENEQSCELTVQDMKRLKAAWKKRDGQRDGTLTLCALTEQQYAELRSGGERD